MAQNVEEIARYMDDGGVPLEEDVAYLVSVIRKLRVELADWVEREAACCPEDVPFDEMVKWQATRIKELTEELAESEKAKRLLVKGALAISASRDAP